MPAYDVTIFYKSFHVIPVEADDYQDAQDKACEIFDDCDKGRLCFDVIDIIDTAVCESDKWDYVDPDKDRE